MITQNVWVKVGSADVSDPVDFAKQGDTLLQNTGTFWWPDGHVMTDKPVSEDLGNKASFKWSLIHFLTLHLCSFLHKKSNTSYWVVLASPENELERRLRRCVVLRSWGYEEIMGNNALFHFLKVLSQEKWPLANTWLVLLYEIISSEFSKPSPGMANDKVLTDQLWIQSK